MKKRFLKYIKKEITNKNKNYSKEKIDEIMYGIEGLYLTITKAIVIFLVAIIFNIFKELILLLLTYNFIRLFAFGMHASKSWHCLTFSLLIFILGAYLCSILIIPKLIITIIYISMLVLFLIYAPADTEKRPLIKKQRRLKYKLLSIMVLLIYLVFSLIIKNNLIINCLTIGVVIECILILPLTYKAFKMPYNNYKTYGLNTN